MLFSVFEKIVVFWGPLGKSVLDPWPNYGGGCARANTGITKRKFLENLLSELNREFEPVLNEILEKKSMERILPHEPFYERIYVDEIDSFKKVKKVNAKVVKDLLPLTMPEKDVKASLASIIGENFIRKDWAGEKSDLYSSNVIYKGKRMSTAFLLKGPFVKRLTIDKCGKRGKPDIETD